MAVSTKTFMKPPFPPTLFTHTTDDIKEGIDRLIKEKTELIDKIVANVTQATATFENVVKPVQMFKGKATDQLCTRVIYLDVAMDDDLRNTASDVKQIYRNASRELDMRKDYFALVQAAYEKVDESGLDEEDRTQFDLVYKDYLDTGLGLEGEASERFKAINVELTKLESDFNKNINEDKSGIWFTEEELKGVPSSVTEHYKKGDGEREGQYLVTFGVADLFPCLQYAANPETRRRLAYDEERRCPDNVAIFEKALVLRDEAARLLGYDTHASRVLSQKMVKDVPTVWKFLNEVNETVRSYSKKDLATLKELKKKHLEESGQEFDGTFHPWDLRFYGRLLRETEYQVDELKISEFFPMQETVTGMLKIYEELIGLRFDELTTENLNNLSSTGKGSDLLWHEDVRVFAVWNDESEGGAFCGYLYMDLHPRDNKYNHACCGVLTGRYQDEAGVTHPDAVYLLCNFTKPTTEKPSLLRHSEIITFFHELGHGICTLTSTAKYPECRGNPVFSDFVEAPSQMLENWCWTPSVLKRLSSHYQTKEPLTDTLISQLVATKNVNEGLSVSRQLQYGLFDMYCHTPENHEVAKSMDTKKLWNETLHRQMPFDYPEYNKTPGKWGFGHTSFGHLMGGYDAGYYGYMYSQVLASDMFSTVFAEDPLDSKAGRKYRRIVLEQCGKRRDTEIVKEFLGREPNNKAFYKDLGFE